VADLESDGELELVLGTLDGQVVVADFLTGDRLWQNPCPARIGSSPMIRRVMVLGGYGGTGREVARLLHRMTDAEIVVAGRSEEKARALAAELNAGAPTTRASGIGVDATDPAAVARAFESKDLVVVLTATPALAPAFVDAALKSGADLLDCHFQDSVHAGLVGRAGEAERAGRRLVFQAGFHPGLIAPLARAAASRLDRAERVTVAIAMYGQPDAPHALREIVDLMQDFHAELHEAGAWRPAGYRDARTFDFGEGFGAKTCMPLSLPEMRALPGALGLSSLGVYIAGWNWLTDWFVSPLVIVSGMVKKGLGRGFLSWLFYWSLRLFDRQQGVVLLAEAEGVKSGAPGRARVVARDRVHPYHFTAVGIVAAALQVLESPPGPAGIHLAGELLDPGRALADLARMGVAIEAE